MGWLTLYRPDSTVFDTVLEAQVLVDERLIKYDTRPAHRGLGV